ncbi:hypothetical protein C8034_v004668 [Colletotrichum sidae]|uniref:CENP-V/GFA domain-containing protein n=2 Tax=Colletotrichum orbiculare species complex TaxID=2707354 RepID=A0A4R8PYU2_9PEZI|nr:hypothetical protein C8035_v004285 [Colletotrichum spinosum]TEA13710.1 hypothetical protein C8034_v004668 [Colletotrichum sidae]
MDARCQCGAVAFKTPLEKPLRLYICHCEECKRQTGSAFGTSAIFPKFQLPPADLLGVYARPTASGVTLYCLPQNKNVVSVKGGCLEGLDWKTAVHIWTNNAMVPIPEGAETHPEEADYTDYGDTQEALDQPTDLRGNGGCAATARLANQAKCDYSG